MLQRTTTLGAAIATLKKEAADRQSAVAILEALTAVAGIEPGITNGTRLPMRRGKRGYGAGRVAIEILRVAGRPLHGLAEICPALEERGITLKHKEGLATMLLRTGEIVRTAPGTFGLRTPVTPHAQPAQKTEGQR